jgi:hypothetical protein
MLLELGNPCPKTELSTATATKQWNKAFADFNRKVGKWIFRTFTTVVNQQRYSMAELFPETTITDVKNVFRPQDALIATYFALISPYYTYDYIITTNYKKYDDIEFIKAMRVVPEMEFTFSEPDTLILCETPRKAESVIIITQEKYTTTTLPDDYEPIISEYCKEFYCQEIIRKARMRVATPLRNGDFVKYPVSHVKEGSFTREAKTVFETECDSLIQKRLIL